MAYRGRFAPSPTGPLHFGSLVTALASYLEARSRQGEWLIRIDDLDQTRCRPGLDRTILHTLEHFGFEWDGEIAYQSASAEYYREALDRLVQQGNVYFCRCSRKTVAAQATQTGSEGPIYPGTCRPLGLIDAPGHAARLRVPDRIITFEDATFGPKAQNLARELGDFVVRRADDYFAYQLAVVVDDWLAGVTDVVRGADLLASTPRQIYLQELLTLPQPRYRHIPLVLGPDGKKLSKRDAAHPVDEKAPLEALMAAWHFLAQEPPAEPLTLSEFWQWAPPVWQPEKLSRQITDDDKRKDTL